MSLSPRETDAYASNLISVLKLGKTAPSRAVVRLAFWVTLAVDAPLSRLVAFGT